MRKKRMYIPLNPLLDALPEITRKIREIENKIYILLIAVVLLGGVFAGVNGLNMFGGIYAQQFCPLPAAPAKVLSLVTITPDSEDGVVDCSSLDIIIGAGGTVVVDRYVTENGTSEGDWGVTLLVKSLTIENGGLISADGKGYTNTDDEVVSGKGGNATTTAGGSGGAHGGAGGEGLAPVGGSAPVPGVAYGTEENPSTLGSAGGNSFDGGLGGNGGGSIRIRASEYLVINGQITANGAQGLAQGNSSGGGGAGGSIWIEAESFSGNGIVEAKGGSAQEVTYQGGGGGGGRIIMFCNSSNLFTGSVSVSPGITSLSQDGGIGSRLGPTCIPNEPTLLKQFSKYDPPGATPLQTVEIGQGGVMRTDRLDSVLFVANMSDIDVTDTLTLQIEVRPIGTSFTGVPTHTQSVNMSNPQNCSSPPSGCGTIDIPKAQLPASTEYHWQARIRDNRGGISEWTQFGNNNDGERDFLITGTPTNILLVSGGNQSGVVGQPLANPMLVRVLDAAGYGVPDQSLTWSIQNGGGTLGSQTSISNTEGVAQNTLTLGVVSGNNSNTVRVSGVGSALDINHSSISDEAVRFSLSTPTVAIRSEEFTFSVIAYDQYNNIATTYDGSPNLSVVNPLNYSQTVGGNFVPSSITFQLGDQGQKVISNATFDTLASIAIKVVDGDIFGYSNAIAIVDTLGQCPDADGIIDSGGDIVWEAGNYPGAIIDCRGLDIVVKSSNTSQVTNLVIRPSLTESVPATLLADSITIESGNSLNSDRRGFTAGQGPGTGCGAAHGGYGVSVSNRGVPYGSVKEPVTMGSGGCTRSYFGNLSVGGEGGGAIKIVLTGNLVVNGRLTADGGPGTSNITQGAVGAGGSLWLSADRIDGSGLISANGGNRAGAGGSGGGRIAIYENSRGSFPITNKSNIQAFGGGGGGYGGAGTIYVFSRSINPEVGSLYLFSNRSNIDYSEDLTAGEFFLHDLVLDDGVKVRLNSNLDEGYGTIYNLTGDFYLGENSLIDGFARGYPSEQGPGAGQTGLGQSGGGGAGHGGSGGNGESDGGNPSPVGGQFYGNQREPLTVGSGGGRSGAGAAGGRGGGAIALRVRTGHVEINGNIDVRGEAGLIASPGGGGGAGGSVLIEGQTCDISGNILANGGNGGEEAFDGGGAGGGRVSILTTQGPCDITGLVDVNQGSSSGGQSGQVGTYPTLGTIPAVPDFRDQFKTDSVTTIPVGGITQEQEVVLKVNMSDPGGSESNSISLQAQFEVVRVDEEFTGVALISSENFFLASDSQDEESSVLGISTSTTGNYSGGAPLLAEASISDLIPGASYKWRARVINPSEGISGTWVEYGGNGSDQADFIVSTVESLTIESDKYNIEVGEPITLTVSSLDEDNQLDPSYRGTVQFISNSETAVLPVNYSYTSIDQGVKEFTEETIFVEPGVYTITVRDTINALLQATTADITVTGDPESENNIDPNICLTEPDRIECQQPVRISNVRISLIERGSVRICWDTNIATRGTINYGLLENAQLTDSVGPESTYKVRDHCLDLTELDDPEEYIFRITAISYAGRSATYTGGFNTLGEVITDIPEVNACILTDSNFYALNAQNQIVFSYRTLSPTNCSFTYSQTGRFSRTNQSQEQLMSHQTTVELSELAADIDLDYLINCSVESMDELISCQTAGSIPSNVFSDRIRSDGEIEQSTLLRTITESVVPLVLVSSAFALLAANTIAYPQVGLYALAWIKDRKRYLPWGIVYDSKNKKPIPFAVVRLYQEGMLVVERLTDMSGRYGMVADPGSYNLVVEHTDYARIAKKLEITKEDSTVSEDFALSIGENSSAATRTKLREVLRTINNLVVNIGFAFAIVITVISPVLINFLVLAFYVVQFVIVAILENLSKRRWGYIFDYQSKSRIPRAFVRLFSVAEERQIDVQIADDQGRYGFSAEPGEYRIKVDADNYQMAGIKDGFLRVSIDKAEKLNKNIAMERSLQKGASKGFLST